MTPDRFFSLLVALRSRPATTVASLAAETGVSDRTVIRDLHWLRDAGFPVVMRRGRYGGVTLLPGGALDTSRLTPAEREHLALTGLDDAQRERLGVEETSSRAMRKVAASRSQDGLAALGDLVVSDNRPWYGREPEGTAPAELVGDLRRGVRLKLWYRRSDGTAGPRIVDPYGLLAKGGRWYLVADQDGRPRLFNLQRLSRWEPLRAAKRLRDGASLAGVAAELTAGWEQGGDKEMRLLIEVWEAERIDRVERMLGSRLEIDGEDERGRVLGRFRYRHLEDVRLLLPFGNTVTVLDPPEARRRLAELASEIFDHYR
ncbi:helix-turn-helix transcriptional regulator [Glycomyces salinus]|uniref:helix-turn-helix transcriptional regulator n=1 Tax=Glycomyces salinus TaxID=980294 RepID=UPI0018EB9936|nr:WYL domain-containing protein [Glycomyces salinus]